MQTEREDLAPIGVPDVGEDVRPQVPNAQIVTTLDEHAESFDELRGRAGRDKGQPRSLNPFPRAWCEAWPPPSRCLAVQVDGRVIAPENGDEAAAAQDTDLERDRDPAQDVARTRPHLVHEPRAAAGAWLQGCTRSHRLDGSPDVAAHDAESIRAHPLKRLLLPLHRNAEHREPQLAARVVADAETLDGWHTRVAIEMVRVRDQRPKLRGARLEPELETVGELLQRPNLADSSGLVRPRTSPSQTNQMGLRRKPTSTEAVSSPGLFGFSVRVGRLSGRTVQIKDQRKRVSKRNRAVQTAESAPNRSKDKPCMTTPLVDTGTHLRTDNALVRKPSITEGVVDQPRPLPGAKRRVFGTIGMEQLWNRGGATGGKRSAARRRENGLIWGGTVATGCHRLPLASPG